MTLRPLTPWLRARPPMSPKIFGILDMALSFGGVFAFGLWQLACLRRGGRDVRSERPTKTTASDHDPPA
ncbi:hypothetical protein CR492_16930 [Methylocella silvestris]|uniref:Uncharacterized protein n=1 Tax=Methylocella silvestris TaxID=199596 RepID=A0A2J7TDE7_METSI|nr:hypothetical protein CR492_16930 [Methylocella silvestris]